MSYQAFKAKAKDHPQGEGQGQRQGDALQLPRTAVKAKDKELHCKAKPRT